jgi:hypothetical protein
MTKLFWIAGIFCTLIVHATTVPPKVTSHQKTKWDEWPTDVLESQYVEALTEKFGGNAATAEDRILLTYIEYLKTKDAKKGEEFITTWKDLVQRKNSALKGPALALFEGASARCWPQAFNGKPFCSQSIGTLTFRYLPALVKMKDKPAMELLALYPALFGSLSGTEAEAYSGFIKDWANSRRHEVMLKEIRASNPQLKAKAFTAALD